MALLHSAATAQCRGGSAHAHRGPPSPPPRGAHHRWRGPRERVRNGERGHGSRAPAAAHRGGWGRTGRARYGFTGPTARWPLPASASDRRGCCWLGLGRPPGSVVAACNQRFPLIDEKVLKCVEVPRWGAAARGLLSLVRPGCGERWRQPHRRGPAATAMRGRL